MHTLRVISFSGSLPITLSLSAARRQTLITGAAKRDPQIPSRPSPHAVGRQRHTRRQSRQSGYIAPDTRILDLRETMSKVHPDPDAGPSVTEQPVTGQQPLAVTQPPVMPTQPPPGYHHPNDPSAPQYPAAAQNPPPQPYPAPYPYPMVVQAPPAPANNMVMNNNQQTSVNVNVVAPEHNPYPPPQNVRDWSSGLCNCCSDIQTCCCYIFCYPCLLCKMVDKLKENCCVAFCCPYGLVILRTKLRTMYGITGSICQDYSVNSCCQPCMVCQMDRELTHVGL